MSKQLSLSDFRAVRRVLEPDDFALGGDEPDPPPSDLIAPDTWNGIVTLPDDVAIRTSDHNGKALGEVYWLWGKWIEATGETADVPMYDPMLDSNDDLQSSMYCALHGYYRAAFSSLRNVLEVITVGACGCLNHTAAYEDYRRGSAEFPFGTACDQLSHAPSLATFNRRMHDAGFRALWDAKDRIADAGYARLLYRELCNYAHTRPGYSEGALWESNGPIYSADAFRAWHYAFRRTVSLCALSIVLSRPGADRSLLADLFTDDDNVLPRDLLAAFKLT